jgi:uncharacterized protein involved in exopolysaccharide biosynthesis
MSANTTLAALIRTAARHWKLLFFSCLVIGAASVGLSLLGPRDWLVRFEFVAESDREGGGATLASELGLGGGASESPDFYVDLLQTDEAILPLIPKKYKTSRGESTTLINLLEINARDEAQRTEKTLLELHRRIVPSVSRRSGVVAVAVRLPDPLVGKSVADDLLAAINTVNTRVRQTKGRNERIFTEERLAVLRSELRVAEESLRSFLERNRLLTTSPSLQMERMRIEREIAVKSATLEAVQVGFEAARRDEVKNTPRISVIEPPRVPALGMSRNTVRKAILAAGITGVILLWLLYNADRYTNGSIPQLVRFAIGRGRHFVRDDA